MNYCKENSSRSHSHMPFEGDIIESLKHQHTNYRSCEKGYERNNPEIDGKGKTKNHSMTDRANHTTSSIVLQISNNLSDLSG
jgi:hypothetical protein